MNRVAAKEIQQHHGRRTRITLQGNNIGIVARHIIRHLIRAQRDDILRFVGRRRHHRRVGFHHICANHFIQPPLPQFRVAIRPRRLDPICRLARREFHHAHRLACLASDGRRQEEKLSRFRRSQFAGDIAHRTTCELDDFNDALGHNAAGQLKANCVAGFCPLEIFNIVRIPSPHGFAGFTQPRSVRIHGEILLARNLNLGAQSCIGGWKWHNTAPNDTGLRRNCIAWGGRSVHRQTAQSRGVMPPQQTPNANHHTQTGQDSFFHVHKLKDKSAR